MPQVYFRFYAELDELLAPTKRGSCFVHAFDIAASVKDVIEALGVPHTEIDLILIDGESVEFSCSLNDGDRISVYPVFRSIDINPLTRVRPALKGERHFVLDTHLVSAATVARRSYSRTLGRSLNWN